MRKGYEALLSNTLAAGFESDNDQEKSILTI